MIKVIMTIAIATVLLASPMVVMADYKADVKKAVDQELINFYEQEKGNKVTEYSIRGLIGRLTAIMDRFVIKEVPPAPEPPKAETN